MALFLSVHDFNAGLWMGPMFSLQLLQDDIRSCQACPWSASYISTAHLSRFKQQPHVYLMRSSHVDCAAMAMCRKTKI